MRTAALGCLVLLGLTRPARSADVTSPELLRASPGFAARRADVRCAVGRAYLGTDDARAALYLAACRHPDDRAERERAIVRLQDAGAGRVEVSATAPDVWVTLDGTPPDEMPAPTTLWLLPGTYRLSTTGLALTVQLPAGGSSVALFQVPASASTDPAELDFGEDAVPEDAGMVTSLPALQHDSLLPDRYRRDLAPPADRDEDAAATRLRLRLGLGVAASQVSGEPFAAPLALQLGASVRLAGPWGLRLQAVGTRRGGAPDGDDRGGVFALSLGALGERRLARTRWLEVTAAAGLRVTGAFEPDLGDRRVRTTSLDGAVGVAVALAGVVVLEGQLDQGLTPLVDGARARGAMVVASLQLAP